jgi:hypothetical protein
VLNYQVISNFAMRLITIALRSNNEAIANEIQTRVSQLKNAVAHVDVFTTSVANQSYSKCAEYLKQQAKVLAAHYEAKDYLMSDAALEHVKMDLVLIDPLAHDIDIKNPIDREKRLLVAHLNILRDDAMQRVREYGGEYSFQTLINDDCYLGLKSKLINFLFVKGVWSERRSFELCLHGFNVVKPWESRICVSLSFDAGNVHHHAKIMSITSQRNPSLNVAPLQFKLHSFNH